MSPSVNVCSVYKIMLTNKKTKTEEALFQTSIFLPLTCLLVVFTILERDHGAASGAAFPFCTVELIDAIETFVY